MVNRRKIMSVYINNAMNLEQNDRPLMAVDLLFIWLTNTTYLQSISASINHVLDTDLQLKLHLKFDEMKSLAMEARFCFKGNSGDTVSEFIEAYRSLLFSMYQYQIIFKMMSQKASEYNWSLEKASEKLQDPAQQKDLFEKELALASSHKASNQQIMRESIGRQIELTSPSLRWSGF